MASDYDSPWKDALGQYFRQFLRFFFPHIEADINWSASYELLDAELLAISRKSKHRKRFADRLVKVSLLSGEQQLVLVHVEVQTQVDRHFPQRMLLYHTRICDKFGLNLCSLAILGDTRPLWRPDCCERKQWGCRLRLDFPMQKLLDYPEWAVDKTNPFAWLTAAHLQAQATRRKPEQRAAIKFNLVRGLYHCGLSAQQIQQFFHLLDWVLALPADLEYAFEQDLARFEEEMSMPYVTSIERRALKKGREEGREEGLQDAGQKVQAKILAKYAARWGQAPQSVQEAVGRIEDFDQLLDLYDRIVAAQTPEELSF